MACYADILCPEAFQEDAAPKDVGATVVVGSNSHPRFTIVAVDSTKAWVRTMGRMTDEAIVPLARLRVVA